MKQVIILMSSILLGIVIVGFILGDSGIFDSMKLLWRNELDIRNMQVIGP